VRLTICPPAHLFKKVPDLKLATAIKDIEYTPLERDVGVVKLPVTF
jgi:nitric oxide reductase